MDLSVVIAAHNEERLLPAQLDAVLAQEWDGDWEVVVVDNASTDRTAAIVEARAAVDGRLRLVRADERADRSYAVNTAVATTTATMLAFCDADDIVAPGWVAAMAVGLRRQRVVTGPNELDRLNPSWLADMRGRADEAAVGTFAGVFPTIRGNNWAITAEAWRHLGGLCEMYFPVDDLELSFRCWVAGIEIVGIPEARVHYRYRPASRALWRQGFSYGSHRPRIVRLLRDRGLPSPPRFSGWKSWLALLAAVPSARRPEGRATLAWIAGNRFGQLIGSIRHRVIAL